MKGRSLKRVYRGRGGASLAARLAHSTASFKEIPMLYVLGCCKARRKARRWCSGDMVTRARSRRSWGKTLSALQPTKDAICAQASRNARKVPNARREMRAPKQDADGLVSACRALEPECSVQCAVCSVQTSSLRFTVETSCSPTQEALCTRCS